MKIRLCKITALLAVFFLLSSCTGKPEKRVVFNPAIKPPEDSKFTIAIIPDTHSYLTASGEIYQGSDYGDFSPQTMYQAMVSKYKNVKLVLSGHEGSANWRTDYGKDLNIVASFLGCFHSNDQNPVQLLEIDTEEGTASIRTYSPIDNEEWFDHRITISNLEFIKK